MKNINSLLLTAILFCSLHVDAQVNVCNEKEVGLNTLMKARNYSGAYIQWKDAKECLLESEAFYTLGERILENNIDNAAGEEKQKLTASLLELYLSYDKNFPANKNGNAVKRALLMQKSNSGNADEIYATLRNAFNNERAKFTDPKALYTYFEIVYKSFQKGERGLIADDIYTLHDEIITWISEVKKTAKSPGSYKTAADGINALIAPIATCDKLVPYYEKAYSLHNNDKAWLEGAAATLSARNCTSTKVFQDIATQWYLLSPDAKSAYNLGMAYVRNRNTAKGLEYLNIAGELEKNPDDKAPTYYSIATLLSSNKAEAIKYLHKAIIAKPSFGKAYLFMAQMYAGAGNECGATEFEKKAIYLLASQTAEKAGVEASLKSAARQVSEMYLKKAPSAEDVKKAGMGGKTIEFKCWINEAVVIPGK